MTKILLYGASGFCGSHIFKALNRPGWFVIGTAFKHTQAGLTYTDLTKYKMVEEDILGCEPDFIIFAAGNKDRNASYKELYRDNTLPIKHIYKVIKEHKLKTRVIFISTDAVFSGEDKDNYDGRVPQPTTNYGKTKYLAEQALEPNPLSHGMKNPVDYRIIRTSAVIGRGSLFLSWLMDEFSHCDLFKVYADQYLSPTSIELLTNAIVYIIENWDKVKQPIIHICGKRMSRYQFACLVAKAINYGGSIYKDKGKYSDTSMVPSDIQKKIKHKPMEEYLKGLLNDL